MEPVRTGIIGFGRWGEGYHFGCMKETGLYDVVAVCDVMEARCAAAKAQGLRATTRLDEFLSWDIELAAVCTHSSQHHEDVLKAAAAGKHLFVEKPLAVTAQQAEEMIAAAKAHNVVLTVDHNRHFDPDYCLVKAAVEDGLLGDIVLVENRTAGAGPELNFATADFRPTWRISAAHGGGVLLDWGPHWIEQVLDLMGKRKVVQVFGDLRHVKWGDVDDLFRADMVFEDGARASAGRIEISHYDLPDKWLVFGTEGTLHGPVKTEKGLHVAIHTPDGEMKRTKAVEARSLHVNVAEHIRKGTPLIITSEHALRVMKVMQATRDSAKIGKSVDVEI